ncbi:anti-sigma factor domain-containing protein [Anaerosolibacter sp.]|uniref:anti-sigma factor domain-containing protein n=1 Tax=Anaerosolibacter sp. TaxID=1872527 RepID=UPI0039F044E8
MAKIQGMVLKIEKDHVVIVTDNGEFRRIPMPHVMPLLGEIIEVSSKNYNNYRPYMAIAAILILLIGFFSYGGFFSVPEAYASVSLDMTPSIELKVNKNNVIIEATAHNDEGVKLLNSINIKGLDVYKAVNFITVKAGEMGFFSSQDKNLVLAAVVPLQNKTNTLNIDDEKLMNIIHDEMYNQKYDGYVVVNNSESDIRNQAQQAGLSVNQYLLQEKSKEQGIEITNDKLRSSSPTQIMYETNFEVRNMFPNNWCEVYESNWNMHSPMNSKQSPMHNSPMNSPSQNIIPNDSKKDGIDPNSTDPSNPRNNWKNAPWSDSDHCDW